MKKRSKHGSEASSPRNSPKKHELLVSSDKRLFKPLKNSPESRQFLFEDLLNSDPDISLKWQSLAKEFPELDKLDATRLGGFECGPPGSDKQRFADAEAFFALVTGKLLSDPSSIPAAKTHAKSSELGTSTMHELVLKIFIVLSQYNTVQLFFPAAKECDGPRTLAAPTVDSLSRRVPTAKMLTNFLFLLLDCYNGVLITKYAGILFDILSKLIQNAQETIVNVAKLCDTQLIAEAFYHHFEALVILSAYSEEHSGSFEHTDLLKAYNSIEKFLFSFLTSDILRPLISIPVSGDEHWMEHCRYPSVSLAVLRGRVKFRLMNFCGAPSLTLGSVLTYYFCKLGRCALLHRSHIGVQEQINTIYTVTKHNVAVLESAAAKLPSPLLLSVSLNVSLLILKFIRYLLERADDPEEFLRQSLGECPKNCILAHLRAALVDGLVAKVALGNKPKGMGYCKFVHDAVAVVFKVLLRLRYALPKAARLAGNKRQEVYPLIPMTDEIVFAFEESVEKSENLAPGQLALLKAYIAEYISSDIRQTNPEQLARLLRGKLFNYTIPSVLTKDPDPAEEYANSWLLATIISGTKSDKQYSSTIVKLLLEHIPEETSSHPHPLFAVLRLLYSVLTGIPCNGSRFSELMAGAYDSAPDYAGVKENPLAVQAFNEFPNMHVVLEKLMENYASPSSDAEYLRVLEEGTLLLQGVFALCENVLRGPKRAVQWVFETVAEQRNNNKFAIGFFRRCLAAARDNKILLRSEDGDYMPVLLERFVEENLDGTKNELALLVYDALIQFVSHEPFFPPTLAVHQQALHLSTNWQKLLGLLDPYFLSVIIIRSRSETSGAMLKRFLIFLGNLTYKNRQNQKTLKKQLRQCSHSLSWVAYQIINLVSLTAAMMI